MRIIAGEHRGRRLLAPDGDQTRPVTDRVKQSIFDVIADRIDGARVYDCFAGTGSFGLEALSRGAAHVTFFESHRPTAALLRQNLAAIRAEARATIVTADCFAQLRSSPTARVVELVFLDPPYCYLNERPQELRDAAAALAERHLADDGVVVFRHDSADDLPLHALRVVDTRSYGSMMVRLLHRP